MATALSIEKFVELRTALLKEKAALESRLARITAALEGTASKISAKTTAPKRRGGKKTKNKVKLREAALQVTRAKPLTRREVLAAVQKLGYKFRTNKPLNSLGVVLYNKKYFRNQNSKFSPAT